jgi:putative Holliday junction resolvase
MNGTGPTVNHPTLPAGRVVGIDYGTVRIGLAVSDPERRWSSPLTVYARQSNSKMSIYFRELFSQERAVGAVVGLPLHTSGAISEKAHEAIEFARWLEQTLQLPVLLYDERFTTALARELLQSSGLSGKKRKERLDKIAAHVLLTAYLESPERAVRWDDLKAASAESQANRDWSIDDQPPDPPKSS